MNQIGLIPSGIQSRCQHAMRVGNGKFVYASTTAIYVYRVEDWVLERILTGHERSISALSKSLLVPHLLVSGSSDKTLRVWDIETGKEEKRIELKNFIPRDVDFSPFDKNIIVTGGEGGFRVYNIKDSTFFSINIDPLHHPVHVSFNPKECDRVYVGLDDGAVGIVSMSQKKLLWLWRAGSKLTDYAWDPLSPKYLLVSYSNGKMILYDTLQDSASEGLVVRNFDRVQQGVNCVAMIDEEPGNFLSGSDKTCVLNKWNISHNSPMEIFRLGQIGGVKECSMLPGRKHVAIALNDGTCGIYDLTTQRWLHKTQGGHTETIFDVKFSRVDANVFATSSYDNSVKLWCMDKLECTDQFTLSHPIYCIAWHPSKMIVAAAMSEGNVAIIDTTTRQTLARICHHKDVVYKIAWNPSESNMLASASRDGTVVVFTASGTVLQKLAHPKTTFGLDFSPVNKSMLATGCYDFNVRIYDVSTNSDQPIRILKGHTAEVYNVVWNPSNPDMLISGSNDRTVRVWNTKTGESKVMTGHTDNVRALCWCTELPWLCLSGSWDGTIRVWDTRSASCIALINDHHADVYGIDSSSQRPFTFVSTSRDTTIRIWAIRDLIEEQLLRSVLGSSPAVASPQAAANLFYAQKPAADTSIALYGQHSKNILAKVKNIRDHERFAAIFELFGSLPSVGELWNLVSVVLDRKMPGAKDTDLVHNSNLTSRIETRAQQMINNAKSTIGRIGGKKTSEVLQDAAMLFLLIGQTKKYCDLMVESGNWDKAIAAAPGVSLEYWKELCARRGKALIENESNEAVPYLFSSGQADKVLNFYICRDQLDESMIVARRIAEGGYDAPKQQQGTGKEEPQITHTGTHTDVSTTVEICKITELKATKFMKMADPIRAACCYLAIDDFAQCIRMLIRGNEPILAYAVAQALREPCPQSLLQIMATKCAKNNMWNDAISFLQRIKDQGLLLRTCMEIAQRVGPKSERAESMLMKCGFQKSAFYLNEAQSFEQKGDTVEAIRCYVLAGVDTKATALSLDFLHRCFSEETWDWAKIQLCANFMNCIDASNLPEEIRRTFLAYINFIGGQEALWKGLYSVAPRMFELVETLTSNDGYAFPISREYVKYMKCVAYSKCDRAEAIRFVEQMIDRCADPSLNQAVKQLRTSIYQSVKDILPAHSHQNAIVPIGSSLPTRSINGERIRSVVSKKEAQQPLVLLEDGRSHMSLSEALAWNQVQSFSPLLTGKKISPH